jgi:hypothetical protein
MKQVTLGFSDTWWSKLTIMEKERVASRVFGQDVKYPECTGVWLNLDEEKKRWVYEHCTTDNFGNVVPRFDDFSFND